MTRRNECAPDFTIEPVVNDIGSPCAICGLLVYRKPYMCLVFYRYCFYLFEFSSNRADMRFFRKKAKKSLVRGAFEKEAMRSGCFEVVDDGSEEYTVDLTVVEQDTRGPYSKFFYMYFAVYIYGY